MNCLGQEKDERIDYSIIKVIRNLFRLNKWLKEIDVTGIKNVRNQIFLINKRK